MFNKDKRILWLLNHRTLMPYECALIRRLGFEVFVPKVLPESSFRSGAVDYSHDSSLSIPSRVLERLNEFNFYEAVWPPEIVAFVNRYFGSAFVMPYGRQLGEVVDNFEGQIVLRAFGLLGAQTYGDVLGILYGSTIQHKIAGVGGRFWFGEGYDNLHEIEAPVLAERSLFLPLGLPDNLWSNADEWQESRKTILFLCPNIVNSDYYSAMYEDFKRDFGDLPHIIIGAQDLPVDDPHVTGFIPDDELAKLFLTCSVLYYPSAEPRHVHYFPIEAIVKGIPVVFFRGSLMDRLSGSATSGRVGSVSEAREVVQRILSGDVSLVSRIRRDQRETSSHFTDLFCTSMWQQQMLQCGFTAALGRKPRHAILRDELIRTVLKPVFHGRARVDPHRHTRRPMVTRVRASQAAQSLGSTVADGIDFTSVAFPAHVHDIFGLDSPEEWGRWSLGERVVISLKHTLEGEFRLFVRALGYGPNAGALVRVKIGSQTRMLRLPASNAESWGSFLHFNLRRPSNIIEFDVPHPTAVVPGGRTVGIGFVQISTMPCVDTTESAARAKFGRCARDGIDFRCSDLPEFVDAIDGLSDVEPWGRRSTGRLIRIELKHVVEGDFRLFIQGFGIGTRVGTSIPVRIGSQTRQWVLPTTSSGHNESYVDFRRTKPSNVIEITVPHGSGRSIDGEVPGVGLVRLSTAQAVTQSAAEAEVSLGGSLADGIDFRRSRLPRFVAACIGLSKCESWGTWSIGKRVTISLEHVLVGEFRLFIRAVGYGRNIGTPLTIRIGSQVRKVPLFASSEIGAGSFVDFDLDTPSSVIELTVPYTTRPPNDNRELGFGLVALALAVPVTSDEAELKSQVGSGLVDGIDFSEHDLPAFVGAFSGLGLAEPWGRWSTGDQVTIELNHYLHGTLRLGLDACGYGPNVGALLAVKIGDETRRVPLAAVGQTGDELVLDFQLRSPSNRIVLLVPHPTTPPNDARTLGVGLIRLRRIPPD